MVKDRPLKDFLALIDSKQPFTLSSWCKQQWMVIFGEHAALLPKDGYCYMHRLCADLTNLIQSRPSYHLGLGSDAVDFYGYRITNYLASLGLQDLDWSKDVFQIEKPEHWQALVSTILRVPLIVVGPPRLRLSLRVLQFKSFVDVPPRNQYLAKDEIVRNTLAALDNQKRTALVTVSAGVISPLVVNDLHTCMGDRHQIVDVHRLWEPFI